MRGSSRSISIGVIVTCVIVCITITSLALTTYLAFATTNQIQAKIATESSGASETEEVKVTGLEVLYKGLGLASIGLAFGMAALAAGVGIAMAGTAALSAAAEKPEISTLGMIITAFAEAIAIYGLVVVIMMLGKL